MLSDGDRLTAADVDRELARQSPVARRARGGGRAGGGAGARRGAPAGTLEASRRDAEKDAIAAALEKSGNNRSMAARLLGISRRGLYHKLAEHGLL